MNAKTLGEAHITRRNLKFWSWIEFFWYISLLNLMYCCWNNHTFEKVFIICSWLLATSPWLMANPMLFTLGQQIIIHENRFFFLLFSVLMCDCFMPLKHMLKEYSKKILALALFTIYSLRSKFIRCFGFSTWTEYNYILSHVC